jgi:ornithine cyclodeaminase/alanine dehydrogenase-like protein (mu-crystallin family)
VRQRTLPAAACLVVFGCGEQAYWHVRLALLARGADIKQVVFVNRRVSESCRHTVKRFAGMGDEVKEREGWAGCEFGVLIRENEGDGYAAVLADVLRDADVVFCCTPATEALFDAAAWEGAEGGAKGRLLVAIGSYTPEMREIPAGLITRALGDGEREAGVVVVDTIEGALTEAGELIDLGVKREQMVE